MDSTDVQMAHAVAVMETRIPTANKRKRSGNDGEQKEPPTRHEQATPKTNTNAILS